MTSPRLPFYCIHCSINLFSKMGDKGKGGVKNLKKKCDVIYGRLRKCGLCQGFMLIASVHGHSHLANLKKCNKFCLCGFQNRQFSHSVPKKVEKNSTTKKMLVWVFATITPIVLKKIKMIMMKSFLFVRKNGVFFNT